MSAASPRPTVVRDPTNWRFAMTRSSILPAALGGVAAAALLSALGTFAANTDTHATREYLVVLAIIVVAGLAVFGWAVPRALSGPAVGWTAIVLSALGLLSVAVFWSGLPPVLAAGGLILGWAQRSTVRGRVALALGVLALAADAVVYIG